MTDVWTKQRWTRPAEPGDGSAGQLSRLQWKGVGVIDLAAETGATLAWPAICSAPRRNGDPGSKTMFSLVIFDCDGVLIDSEIISARMLVSELARLGVEIDLDYVTRNFLGRSYPTVMKQIRSEFGLTLPDSFEDDYRENLLQAFRRDLRVVPHVTEVLANIGVPFCVATSSSPRRAAMSLALVGLDHLVGDRLFTSTLVERGKPAPDLFLLAADRMGADPARTLVIEDSLTGIRAGLAAGMTVWRFVGGGHLGPATLEEPEDARPQRRLVSFETFFQIAPDLKKGAPTP